MHAHQAYWIQRGGQIQRIPRGFLLSLLLENSQKTLNLPAGYNPLCPQWLGTRISTYGKFWGKLHLDQRCPLEATSRPLTVATTTTTITVRVRRTSDDDLLGKVDLRDGGGDLDLRVGLRTVVDGGGRHLVKKKRLLGKRVVSNWCEAWGELPVQSP